MSLPIRTTIEDVDALCSYLITKPTGASVTEAKAVVDEKVLDGRKLNAMKAWGLIVDEGGKLKPTEAGRRLAKDKFARKAEVLAESVSAIAPYRALVERAVHRNEATFTATEVASFWHQHFKAEASENDKILNDQAVCFFHIAQGADLGTLVVGRKGQPTRFAFDLDNAKRFVDTSEGGHVPYSSNDGAASQDEPLDDSHDAPHSPAERVERGDGASAAVTRVFITHGKNTKILGQVKQLVEYGKFEPVVAQEREAAAKPVPDKVMDEMRACQAAVIHVGLEGVIVDNAGAEHPQVNGNVLIEIGAAMALYRRNFILLVEEGVKLPSNLQGLYECRYKGDELNMDATMKLLKAFSEFR